ncbi:heterocycloanthracin/sonorensin family bacteriocin [Aneurinibacillus thermoaerophilus]|uniref:heterocycloanthracin/sonorensin family bacteriocin n=1 Tax=Aneurinibacillus thermoaerophilus TaxID=143495 RepID=UPI002E2204B3|nr:heterocycloanthracin/sonorensin family bacteriocin [Aneurinibacillus thermoaerophilus]
MDDFQKELQGLNVGDFQAGPMIPVSTQDQYYDYTRQCGRCGGGFGGGFCSGFGGGFCSGFGGGFCSGFGGGFCSGFGGGFCSGFFRCGGCARCF